MRKSQTEQTEQPECPKTERLKAEPAYVRFLALIGFRMERKSVPILKPHKLQPNKI